MNRNSYRYINLCQKLSFLNQLTHKMTRDCILNSPKNTSSEHVVKNKYCFECQNKNKKQFSYTTCCQLVFSWNSMNNLSSYCGLTDSRMRASDTDLPAQIWFYNKREFTLHTDLLFYRKLWPSIQIPSRPMFLILLLVCQLLELESLLKSLMKWKKIGFMSSESKCCFRTIQKYVCVCF